MVACGGDRTVIYLASPYSHPDPAVRQRRYEAAVAGAAELWRRGHVVFSPIAHSHPIALHGIEGTWEQWLEFDTAILAICDELRVLMMEGWDESSGVAAEVQVASARGIAITYWRGPPRHHEDGA